MTTLRLRTVTRSQGNNAALKLGQVQPSGCELEFVDVDPLVAAFRRMVRGLEFDVCEMAITTYLTAREHGTPFTALPVFLVRGLHHEAIRTRRELTDSDPRVLEGTRVGINRGYTVTTGVWARAVLAREHGVDLDAITWVLSGDEHVAEYQPPANVDRMPAGADLGDMVARGELSAAIGVTGRDDLPPLLHDPRAQALAAVRRDGFWPINHLIVVRDELLAARPELAADLFEAFAESKRRWFDGLAASEAETDRDYRDVAQCLGGDPLPYGIEPNLTVLSALLDAACAQHILRERPDLSNVFAAETLSLVG